MLPAVWLKDYAACLELRSEECQLIENSNDDPGVLIMQLLIDNISRPAPNITLTLLKFDLDSRLENIVTTKVPLQVVLQILEKLWKPEANALLHEFGIQHLDSIGTAPFPKRSSHQNRRISSLHQVAIVTLDNCVGHNTETVELHAGDMTSSTHRESCQSILTHIFGLDQAKFGTENSVSCPITLHGGADYYVTRTLIDHVYTTTLASLHIIAGLTMLLYSPSWKSLSCGEGEMRGLQVLELLEVVQFKCPDTTMKSSQGTSNFKYDLLAQDVLGNPATPGKGGIYYYSERGDRLIDLTSFRDNLWQKCNALSPQLRSTNTEAELNEIKDTIQQLLRWGWKYNKNLEEQAAQLHMLTGWSQLVEVSASRRISLLDASLSASASPDCSLKMALILSQVALTCMAKLRDERFLCPGAVNSDTVTFLDIMTVKKTTKRGMPLHIYCEHMLDPDVPTTVLQFLLHDDQDGEDLDLQKVDKEQAEMARAKLFHSKERGSSNLGFGWLPVIKDATQGSEAGKTLSLYVLDTLICIDHERFFLGQLQSRGFLRSCFVNITNNSYQGHGRALDSLQRTCTLEATLALLLRISHKYGKTGAQVLFSMGALEHVASCRLDNVQGSLRQVESRFRRDGGLDKPRTVVAPVLRLVFSLTSLIDTSDFFEVKNKIVREVVDFIKGHQFLFDQVLREDISEADESTVEQINLVVGILSKVWPYEDADDYGFVQGLFGLMHALFSNDSEFLNFVQALPSPEKQRKFELNIFQLCFSLSSYLYFLVTKKFFRLQVSNVASDYSQPPQQRQPTLISLGCLLNSVTTALERAADEKSLLLNKIQDINELSRQEVDEIIHMYVQQDCVSSSDNIQKRRYIGMIEMCRVVGNRDQLITLLLPLAEHLLNVILLHFQEGSITSDTSDTVKRITYDTKSDLPHELSLLCGKLIPILERLESLSEDKIGHNLKVFRRLVSSLKEYTIQKLTI
ncbi:Nucleoporin Nup186/Nup192/Nup205 [Dillenia turbinata]|uniref:Nucleoporin Nup186/Nup192/Nup205 n=1 Tax=Dillenia turbinata TaxID=194707 RepID=A0AAN8ZP90_9MAGN